MRLPNGFGNISKLSGNRRNPWRARKTDGWDIDETTKKAKQRYITIGYYPTRQAALQALSAYNQNPYDLGAANITFAEVYEKWSDRKYSEISTSNVNGYKASFNACSSLWKMKMADIKLNHLQSAIDKSGKNAPTKKKIKVLFNQMFDFAVMHDIIPKDRHIVEYVKIGTMTKSTLHYRFSDEEIEKLWAWSSENEYVQVILMLIYSGVRPGELFALKTSDLRLDERYFNVVSGKNANAVRRVPIHHRTLPFFKHWAAKGTEYLVTNLSNRRFNFETKHTTYKSSFWSPVLSDIGILFYKNEKGDTAKHLPDDTRHTFTSMWSEKKLDEAMRRKIQGHSGKGIGEMVYTHFDMQKLLEEIDKL